MNSSAFTWKMPIRRVLKFLTCSFMVGWLLSRLGLDHGGNVRKSTLMNVATREAELILSQMVAKLNR